MQDLIERLETATTPDRELDAMIAAAVDQDIEVLRNGLISSTRRGESGPREAPAYTTSIDEALTLVPEGYSFHINQGSHIGGASCWLCPEGPDSGGVSDPRSTDARHAISAIALCIAALKARQAACNQ